MTLVKKGRDILLLSVILAEGLDSSDCTPNDVIKPFSKLENVKCQISNFEQLMDQLTSMHHFTLVKSKLVQLSLFVYLQIVLLTF
jgi:hypothetical protein